MKSIYLQEESSADAAVRPSIGEQRRAVTAGMVGYVLEWFDFGVYGFLATIIAKNFFPSHDELTSLLASFGVFGVGFVARPLGSVIFGRIADKFGRHTTLATTMILMAVSSTAIGLLPTYESLGIAAPILLILARLAQGFSAGGEWGTAATFLVEWGGSKRRGFFGAFQQSSIACGLLLGSGAVAVLSSMLSPEALTSWGWRLPFLVGALLGPVGWYVRRRVQESPVFVHSEEHVQTSRTQFLKAIFHGFSFLIFWSVSSYMVAVFMPSFAITYGHISRPVALWSGTASLALVVVAAPLAGALSDRIGRKPLLVFSCVFFVFLSYPLYRFIVSGLSDAEYIAVQLLMNLIFVLYSGAGPASLAELFPTRLRSTGVSVGAGLAGIFGGFSPFLTTWAVSISGSGATAGWLLTASALFTLPALLAMQDRARHGHI
ncbi:MFS transporter [Paraburkholderia sp. Ac-20347]|uniref:MFS transporter n=1 Tax=Paraburkholderia sp. Ac-20347 TaxID=2703892 RepID=UPI001981E01E|nr:MFS transporter [Paraburkholderia sp. Ac-20347]MBN3811459.1 MHS family MFS transporter [Paraburkholderia sp. Ac-20347]